MNTDNHIIRNYRSFDRHLDDLMDDIYPAPSDKCHTSWAYEVIKEFMPHMPCEKREVLDVGCGDGFARKIFELYDWNWTGATLGKAELINMSDSDLDKIYETDMTMLPFADNSFDCVFARHVMEHSPFPLISLMEWRRVARKYLMLVVPNGAFWGMGARNHYYLLSTTQIKVLFKRAGWLVTKETELKAWDSSFYECSEGSWKTWATIERNDKHPNTPVEFRFLCSKTEPQRD